MGTYTSTQGFYKPSGNEIVDVESQLNYNLRRADSRVRVLTEWKFTTVSTISGSEAKETGFKWFKPFSNSLWVARDNTGSIWPSCPNSQTDPWVNPGLTMSTYNDDSDSTWELCYRKEPTDGMVHWRGRVRLGSFSEIPLNTNIQVAADVPTEARPVKNKYFFVHMGFASGNYSVARILMRIDGIIEICRMGVNQSEPTQRYVPFASVRYPTNDV